MKTSTTQFDNILTFMEQHGDLSRPANQSNGRLVAMQKWEELALILNKDPAGDSKVTEKWKKVWSDFKNNTKKKAVRIHRAASGISGGPAVHARLTDLELRAIKIMREAPPKEKPPCEIPVALTCGIDVADLKDRQDNLTSVAVASSAVEKIVDLSPIIKIEPVTETYDAEFLTHSDTSTPQHDTEDCSEVTFEGIEDDSTQEDLPSSSQPSSQYNSRKRPRTVRRPSQSHVEQASPQVESSDEEWRRFRMKQRDDQMRIREMELKTQRDWQALGLKALELFGLYLNKQ